MNANLVYIHVKPVITQLIVILVVGMLSEGMMIDIVDVSQNTMNIKNNVSNVNPPALLVVVWKIVLIVITQIPVYI
jgi:hypothetical protein